MSRVPETDAIEMTPVAGPVKGSIRPPGSKSITNRALICAALAEGSSTLRGALESEDTQVMIAALKQLGIGVEVSDRGRTLRVNGCGGKIPAKAAELFVANSGTSMRFLTAMATIGQGVYKLDGIARMRERPIGDLVDSLRQLGVQLEAAGANHCPPVVVNAAGLPGGVTSIRGDVSSQFLSGLLMAAPYAQQSITLNVSGTLVSIPYVDMTIKVMESFGGQATAAPDHSRIEVSNAKRYRGLDYAIEPDASAASYFFAGAAITGGRVTVEGLSRKSLQGDVEFCDCLAQMGASVEYGPDSITVQGSKLHGIDVDMNGISDTVQTLSVVALFAEGPTRMRNVAHIRHKETDRIGATACELRKLGANANEYDDGLEVIPGPLHGAAIDTYNDHRMAMSFALAGLRIPGVTIRDRACTSKTYPDYFEDLARLIAGA
ncbi:3-phosphoshikimate 1-carboxyvinyltransferase [Lacipirellula limnantheis]|uniref:3-phosphoshikimate 1-carboxyvinyltransferase n=1 Tax=Lacipirellula limnantheis TaxID=2528024 RepID=A0A517TZW0_9BACT|nr:3-phosphoshikimate 1-carboxyvinyltransferase [Lacipirellula limnantheis]QDT73918.1 3-phosphoshikimate 1-carboxyvinyltransferase [Lacipirellula limnantheis]